LRTITHRRQNVVTRVKPAAYSSPLRFSAYAIASVGAG